MKETPKATSGFSLPLAALFALFIVGALFIAQVSVVPQVFDLRFNVYALISLVSFTGNLVVLTRLVLGRARSEEAVWFGLVLLGNVLFSGGELMQRFSASPTGAIFWAQLGSTGVALISVGLFVFAKAYTKPNGGRIGMVAPLFVTVSMIVGFFYAQGSLLYDNNPNSIGSFPWGFNTSPGPALWAGLVWAAAPSLAAAVMLLRFRHKSHNRLLRSQSMLFAFAILVPVATGLVTDGVLPLLGVNVLPPLATFFELITSILLFYGIQKYQFFQINPTILSENILTTMNEAVVVTRRDFKVEYVNKEAERLLGKATNELASTYVHTLFTPNSWPKVHAFLSGEGGREDDPGDIAIMNSAGNAIPVRVFTSSIHEGEQFQAYIFVISDITDITASYKKLESNAARISKLLAQSTQLQHQLEVEKAGVEHTVEVRTHELQQAQERLKETDKLKTEFMTLGAHNLRTPITIMAGSLEMLKEPATTAKQRDLFMESLQEGINRLKDFVEDMVAITMLEVGDTLLMEPITAQELLRPLILEAHATAATKKSVEFISELELEGLVVNASTKRLQGAIRNLVSNSFKFTKTGSVKFSASAHNDMLKIVVSDTGIGIEKTEMPKLFTKFHRGTDTLRYEYEGEGIGLYLTKLVIDQHDGSIAVKSMAGKGTQVTVTIPLSKQKVPAAV